MAGHFWTCQLYTTCCWASAEVDPRNPSGLSWANYSWALTQRKASLQMDPFYYGSYSASSCKIQEYPVSVAFPILTHLLKLNCMGVLKGSQTTHMTAFGSPKAQQEIKFLAQHRALNLLITGMKPPQKSCKLLNIGL